MILSSKKVEVFSVKNSFSEFIKAKILQKTTFCLTNLANFIADQTWILLKFSNRRMVGLASDVR